MLASGAGRGYFGHDEWAQWAPGLKTIEDARHIRSQLLLKFERAERTAESAERQRLLSIAIVSAIVKRRQAASGLGHLAREDRERLSHLVGGVRLAEIPTEHQADEIAAALQEEMP